VDQAGWVRGAGGGPGMRRGLTVLLLLSGAVSALLVPSPVVVFLVGMSVTSLVYGFRRRSEAGVLAAGWLLYFPLSVALLGYLGIVWSFLVCATYVTLVTERLSFENELSEVLESKTGLDAEAKALASRLSRDEATRVLRLLGLIVVVSGAGFVLTGANTDVSLLVFIVLLLLLASAAYAYVLSKPPEAAS
jgi:hypothetical protein